jgi:hypothetical protein
VEKVNDFVKCFFKALEGDGKIDASHFPVRQYEHPGALLFGESSEVHLVEVNNDSEFLDKVKQAFEYLTADRASCHLRFNYGCDLGRLSLIDLLYGVCVQQCVKDKEYKPLISGIGKLYLEVPDNSGLLTDQLEFLQSGLLRTAGEYLSITKGKQMNFRRALEALEGDVPFLFHLPMSFLYLNQSSEDVFYSESLLNFDTGHGGRLGLLRLCRVAEGTFGTSPFVGLEGAEEELEWAFERLRWLRNFIEVFLKDNGKRHFDVLISLYASLYNIEGVYR